MGFGHFCLLLPARTCTSFFPGLEGVARKQTNKYPVIPESEEKSKPVLGTARVSKQKIEPDPAHQSIWAWDLDQAWGRVDL